MYQEEISRIREEAVTALHRLDVRQEHESPRLRQLRAVGQAAAHAIVAKAQAPLAIGGVGEYNTAKSTVISVLLGNPRLLSHSENPTTGNVTVLRLRPGTADVPARMLTAAVQFLTEEELARCVAFVLGRLREAATRDIPARGAAAAFAGYNPAVDGWDRFDTWCRTALWDTATGDIAVKLVALELVGLRDAQLNAAAMIGQRRDLDVGIVTGGVVLPLPDTPPSVFPEFTATHGLRWDLPLDADRLRVAFPLVRQIDVDVEVSPALWPLRDLRADHAMEVRDFPGLNAQGTQWRDLFVSRLGLDGIDAIMVLVDARKPAAAATLTFYSELRRLGYGQEELDRATVVAASYFDHVPPPNVGGAALGLEELLDTPGQLRGVYVAAQNLTGARREQGEPLDKAVLVSALPALVDAGVRTPDPQALAAVRRAQAAWGEVADRLLAGAPAGDPAGAPATHLAHLLREYAADGGFAALRTLIEDHLRQHGLPNKLAQLRRSRKELAGALADYDAELAWLASQHTGTSAGQAQRIATFFSVLAEAARQVRDDAREFRDPTRLRCRAEDQDVDEPILAAAAAEAHEIVWFWQPWQAIVDGTDWNESKPPRPVVPSQPTPSPGMEPAIPQTTEKLAEEFLATVDELVRTYRALVLDAVEGWDARRRELLAEPAGRLDDPELHALAVKVLGPERMAIVEDLLGRGQAGQTERTETIRARAERAVTEQAAARRGSTSQDTVPFPARHALPWHPGYTGSDEGDEQNRHLAHVPRLRHEAVLGVARYVQEQVMLLAADVSVFLEKETTAWIDALPAISEIQKITKNGGHRGRRRRVAL